MEFDVRLESKTLFTIIRHSTQNNDIRHSTQNNDELYMKED